MVSKKVLKNIGVFAMSAILVAAPALAASANPGDLVARVAVHDETEKYIRNMRFCCVYTSDAGMEPKRYIRQNMDSIYNNCYWRTVVDR